MARSSFGGSGDYSSLFGGLYAQAKALKDQQQSAADQDAYDRWKNGLSTDQEWLAYIQSRADATSSDKDPTNHQHWIQLQRQYVTSIADSTAEFAFANGQTSIGGLIQYYQDRLSRLQSNSDEYRQLAGHLNDLVDKRDSEDLSQGAQEINSKIQAGKATYEDLLKFYQAHLSGLRDGSDLYKQVQTEISNVKDTISQTKLNGQFEKLQYQYQAGTLSGRSYAAQLTAMAQQFKASDPQKYYQILEAANRVSKAGSGSSGGGGSGGGGSLSGGQKSLEDQLKSVDNYLELFATAYKAGARVIPDPMHPGQQIVLSPELMSSVDQSRLQNYDKLATLYKSSGKNTKYTQILENKTKYIVDFVQPHNTVAASQQWGQLVGSTIKAIEANANNPDPEQALRSIVSNLNGMNAWIGQEVQRNGKLVAAENQPSGDFLTNSSDFVAQALQALTDPNMDSKSRSDALQALADGLDSDTGAHYDKGTQTAMKKFLIQAGAVANASFDLATGKKVLAITPDKGMTLVDVRVQHTLAVDPATGQTISNDLQTPDIEVGNGQRLQEVWIDKGGTPTKVFAVVDTAPSPYKVWVAQKSVTIGGKTYAQGAAIPSDVLGNASFAGLVQSGAVAKKDAFQAAGMPMKYVQVPAYDDNGKHHDAVTYYQDPQTKLWYTGQPPISSASLNSDGTVKIGADGKLGINWMPFANVGGVAVPYAGSNLRAMQDNLDSGLVGKDPRYNEQTGFRDVTGGYTADSSQSVPVNASYFDPRDESLRSSFRNGTLPGSEPQPDPATLLRSRVQAARQRQVQLLGAEAKSAGQAFDANSVTINVKQMADSLGISLDPSSGKAKGFNVPAPDANAMAQRRQKLQSEFAAPTIKAAPVIPMPDMLAEARLASGPALANLPKTSAVSGIDPTKIVGITPPPATKPGATWSAPTDVSAKSTVQQTQKTKSGQIAL